MIARGRQPSPARPDDRRSSRNAMPATAGADRTPGRTVEIADRGDEFVGATGAHDGRHQVERLGLDLFRVHRIARRAAHHLVRWRERAPVLRLDATIAWRAGTAICSSWLGTNSTSLRTASTFGSLMRATSCTLAKVAPRSTIISATRCCRQRSGLVLLSTMRRLAVGISTLMCLMLSARTPGSSSSAARNRAPTAAALRRSIS